MPDTTANFGWAKPATTREELLELLLRGVLDDIDSDLKTYAFTPYAARVINSAAISVGNATATALTFNSERRDDGGLHSTSSNTDRLTAPVSGWYLLWANAEFASNATGLRALSFRVGATPDIFGVHSVPAISGSETNVSASCLIFLGAGDYVRLFAFQNSGGALNVNAAASYSPEFAMILLMRT